MEPPGRRDKTASVLSALAREATFSSQASAAALSGAPVSWRLDKRKKWSG